MAKKATLKEKLGPIRIPKKRSSPVWGGPEKDGITFSLLSRFLSCRERFRLLVVEGLKPRDTFSHRLEFGNMWHVCEESLAGEVRHFGEIVGTTAQEDDLKAYCEKLCLKYPFDREQIDHWYQFTKAMFPIYVDHWAQHSDVLNRTPLLQEQVFDVPYKLPSGRTVRLRGKWDSVDLIGDGVWLQENKTKSQIDTQKIARQVSFDLQTMMYTIALKEWCNDDTNTASDPKEFDYPIAGVRYNVIRRSAHKSIESLLKKITEDKENGRIGEWFARWKVEISPTDIAKFQRECFNPILEQLCQWWDWCRLGDPYRPKNNGLVMHWRHPFGVWNVLDEGGSSELDNYLTDKSEVGLHRVTNLFPELEESK